MVMKCMVEIEALFDLTFCTGVVMGRANPSKALIGLDLVVLLACGLKLPITFWPDTQIGWGSSPMYY